METAKEYKERRLAEHIKETPCKKLYGEGSVLITTSVGVSFRYLDDSLPVETTAYDYPIAELFQISIKGIYPKSNVSRMHILLEVDEWLRHRLLITNRQYQTMSDETRKFWFQESSFCVCVSDPDRQIRYQLMFDKLNKYFGDRLNISAHYESRRIKCFCLVRNSNAADVASRRNPVYRSDAICIEDAKPSEFVDLLNNSSNNLLDYVIVDETNFLKNISIQIKNNLSKIEVVNDELQNYNLKLIEAVRDVGMIVIKQTA